METRTNGMSVRTVDDPLADGGKRGRAKADAPTGENPLPAGWEWVRLGDIAEIEMGNSPPGTSYNTTGRGEPLINGPTEFGPGPLDHPTAHQFTDRPSKFCAPGDLLICVRGSTTGRTNIASFRACIGRGVAAVRAYECQPYVNHYLASQTTQLLAAATGSTFPSISRDLLGALAVPLPPLEEQARIVDAIELSLSDVTAGVAALGATAEDLTRFRASVLQSAVTGQLTSVLGAPAGDESAADLLKEILRVRRERAMAAGDDGQGTLLPALDSRYEQPPEPDTASLPQLPERWAWATFGQLCEVRLGRAKNPANRAKLHATPYLRAANITEDGLDLSDVLQMDFPPSERDTYRLRAGDLIVSEASGSPDQVGKPAIWKDELPVCCFQNTVIRLRPVLVKSEYVLVLLQHCYFNRVFAALSGGVGINHLGAKRLARLPVALAPAAEQRIIIEEVGQQLATLKVTKSELEQELARATQLREAVLTRAFRGELVEPRSAGEPVSALLARLHARREEDRAARQQQIPVKQVKRMPASQRRPLLEVLEEHPDGISPEDLLVSANYPPGAVDEFYARLSDVWDSVVEEKPAGDDALDWPHEAQVLLRLKSR